jgi:hypothetical protein
MLVFLVEGVSIFECAGVVFNLLEGRVTGLPHRTGEKCLHLGLCAGGIGFTLPAKNEASNKE